RIVTTCYDLREKRWRPVDAVLTEIRGVWRGGASPPPVATERRSFDIDCAGCHASQSTPRFDLVRGGMESGGGDESINCETCHGPGAEHVRAWRRLDGLDATGPHGTPTRMPDLARLSPRASTALCARCHGGPPTAADFGPGDAGHYVTTIED